MTKDTKRTTEMKLLRKQGKSLKEIGDIYGVTRERVRQIIGNTGAVMREIFESTYKANEDKTRHEAVLGIKRYKGSMLKAMGQVWHPASGGVLKLGLDAEKRVSEKLTSLGIRHSLTPTRCSYDISIGDKKIEVKACFKSGFTSKKQKRPSYRFHVRKGIKGDYCDYFIFYIEDTGNFFVVPNSEVNNVETVYISDPPSERAWSKWHDFKNRFDLLEKK